MADVAQASLQALDQIDFDKYQDGGGGGNFAPPPEGVYVGKLPMITEENFGSTAEGKFKLSIPEVEIVNPSGPGNGYKVKYCNFSSKKYANREGSQIFDLLRACNNAARPTTVDQLKGALKMLSGKTFKFQLVWEAYNKDTKETTSGQDAFGGKTYVLDPFDETKKLYANGKIRYTISAIAKQ